MTIAIVWLVIILLVAAGIVLVVRQRRLSPQNEQDSPSLKRNVFNLQIGDIVQYMERDWVVEGKLIYEESGFSWSEYMLQDGDDLRWLSVEEDDTVEVQWLEPTQVLDISGEPPPELTFAGETYYRQGSGVANMKRIGTVQRRNAEKCRYYDYEGEGENVLSIEDWDGEIEVTVGRTIRPSDLSLLPGGGDRIYRYT